MSFGAELRRIRIEKGMTQEQCADEIGVTREAWGRWERGHLPKLRPFRRIIRLFDVDLDDLVALLSEIDS